MFPLGFSRTLQAVVITCPDFNFETLEGTQCFRGNTKMGRNLLCWFRSLSFEKQGLRSGFSVKHYLNDVILSHMSYFVCLFFQCLLFISLRFNVTYSKMLKFKSTVLWISAYVYALVTTASSGIILLWLLTPYWFCLAFEFHINGIIDHIFSESRFFCSALYFWDYPYFCI